MTTARATMVTLVIAVVPRRPQCWRPGIPIGTRGTHKYPAGHGGAEGRGYLLGSGKAKQANTHFLLSATGQWACAHWEVKMTEAHKQEPFAQGHVGP